MTQFPLRLERELRLELLRQLQTYLRDEFDVDAGELAAGLFLDFAGRVLGPAYYNRGLRDALAVLAQHADAVEADVLALEKELNPRPQGGAS